MATFVPRPPGPYVSVVAYDVRDAPPDVVTVDLLARLELVARRSGHTLELHNTSAELVELVAFMGLDEVLKAR